MRILILSVNYNSYYELKNFLHSIETALQYAQNVISVDLMIADNTTNNIMSIDTSSFQKNKIEIFTFHENLGYMGAIEKLIEIKGPDSVKGYDYTILSNVDLLLTEEFFANLLNIPTTKNIGWVAPQIFSLSEKRDRNPKIISRPSAKRIQLLLLMYKYPILYRLYSELVYRFRNKKLASPTNNKIYAGHGSLMIFTKAFMKDHASFKFPSFLFGEEIFFGELVRSSNLQVVYMPQIAVQDIDHASTSKLKRKNYCKMNYESLKKLKLFFENE
ncbi:MAG: hypothetical protein K9H26_16500 [Prolixibacteraceae bacterium]|nr:hypothetical protein [Prolixibacteraceae bacterium]